MLRNFPQLLGGSARWRPPSISFIVPVFISLARPNLRLSQRVKYLPDICNVVGKFYVKLNNYG